MKKTLTVNISGIVFHIDEDAYSVLNDYLQSIKQHFAKTDGRDEIISDIEARIAEMLRESTGNEKQVITIEDIEKIIEVIGMPEEFEGEPEDENYRKQRAHTGKTSKRLYRDPDNTMIGGVCGGLGAYFHSDPVWFRLIFVIAVIVGIGTGLLVYLVLWIVIPEAKTTAEKLEMRGEKVNMSNIEKSIREEIDNLKNKFSDFSKEAKQKYKKKNIDHKSDLNNIGNALTRVLELFVKIVLVFAGIVFAIIGITLLVGFIVTLFGFGGQIFIIDAEPIYISLSAISEFILGSTGSNMFFKTGLILFLGVPLFMLLYAGVKLIFGIRRTRYVGISALNLWLAGLILTGFYGFKIAKGFSHNGFHKETVKKEMVTKSPIYVDVNQNDKFDQIFRYEDYFDINELNMIITTDENDLFYGIPQMEIEKNDIDKVEVEIYYRSKGKSRDVANARAERIIYNYQTNDTLISFDPFFKLVDNDVWREQQIEIVLKIPEGCFVQFSDDMYKIINDRHHSPYRLSGKTWQMTHSGLEETDYFPVEIEEQEETEDTGEILKEIPEKKSKPVSMISFIYFNFLQFLGITV